MMRNGIIPTKAGLVFIAGNDGKMRAYDEDNGKLLWTGVLPGPSRGVPVVYEAKGRQYLVVAATPPGGGGRGGGGRRWRWQPVGALRLSTPPLRAVTSRSRCQRSSRRRPRGAIDVR